MDAINFNGLKNFIPNIVKIEIIKEELLKLYLLEQELNKLIDSNKYNDKDLETQIKIKRDDLISKYFVLINIMKVLNFSELDKENKIVYNWAKEQRRKLGLSDNLYNVYEEFIPDEFKYEEVNENIGNRLML